MRTWLGDVPATPTVDIGGGFSWGAYLGGALTMTPGTFLAPVSSVHFHVQSGIVLLGFVTNADGGVAVAGE